MPKMKNTHIAMAIVFMTGTNALHSNPNSFHW
jgi:hypothetical protein